MAKTTYKVKIYKLPNPFYKENEPGAKEKFDAEEAACSAKVQEMIDDGWDLERIAGGDSVACIIFSKK